MLVKHTKVFPGGLMRCCDATITDYFEEHHEEEIENGFVLDCKYEPAENESIIFIHDHWQWNHLPYREA